MVLRTCVIGKMVDSSMSKIWCAVPVLVSALCLFVSACAFTRPAEDTVFADGPRGAVLLQHVEDSWFKTAHPVSVNPRLLTHVLRGVQVQVLPNDQTTAVQVFSEDETAFLSPLISTALSQATKNQLVAFRVTQGTDPGGTMTGGLLFTRGRLLHLWLTHYRAPSRSRDAGATQDQQARHPQGLAPRQLRFVPEAAQQSSRNYQPDVIDPPPLATLVIDYKELAAQVHLPSETTPAQPLPTETQVTGSGHGPSGSHETTPSGAEETRALKDVVKEQALELDALKEDMRALRKRLSEMDVPPSNGAKPPLIPR